MSNPFQREGRFIAGLGACSPKRWSCPFVLALGAAHQSQAPLPFHPFHPVPAKINTWKDLSPGKVSSLMLLTRMEEGGNRHISGWRQRERGRWKGGEDRISLPGRAYTDQKTKVFRKVPVKSMARWMLWYQEQVQRNLRQENSGEERAQSSASFTHLYTQPAFMLIQDFFCFNRSPTAIKQRNPHAQQRPGFRDAGYGTTEEPKI